MKLLRDAGSTSQIFQIFIADSTSTTGGGKTGLVFNTSGLTAYFHRDTDTTATAISLVTMTAGTFTSSGFKEIDSTNMPGWYQFCPPNTALASGASSVSFHLQGATGMAPLPIEVDLDGLVDLVAIQGTNVSAPATAGILDVNVKNMNNVAATSITTISANQGTTQPVNFSGTGASAFVKSDTEQLNAQSVTAAAGVTFPSSVASPTNITAGTITTVTNLTNAPTSGDFTATMKTSIGTAVAASAVASVTGNVGGNVTGSVGSVTGNVGGSVASVTAAVTASGTSPLTEAYPAQGAALTLASALYTINQFLGQHSTGGTTTWTLKKRDGSTTAKTYTLDSATAPTSITEAT